ncbi:hypothetical protein F5Y00DRAFT_247846 [Daldinia vernicosa]|uniref:uncharacterized protein n=1 Tax=Daldinia vernicosa TaxID=114800 RepID=UPI0020078787|nr:uncharacterized protein F5Y00DRAFT_247846 [Daldinia vernicosa]KAI0844844.1 hypothetical protein F5Y00DRAFT_247846 [Daldinia vernicosa]
MAPGQNTFTIIPNPLCAINGGLDASETRPSKRPMTSKQAKKAYQKTNKGPKLSKAEQRRQELFEQDRIRREFEKEKNQARARAARDKKKEKEEKERAERKKKGLPLVDVHPSQATIAWFVRGDKKKKPESQTSINSLVADRDENDVSDSATLSGEDEPEPPPKKQKTVPLGPGHSPSFAGGLNCSASPPRDPDARGTPQAASNTAKGLIEDDQMVEHLTPDVESLSTMVFPDDLSNDPVDDAVRNPPGDDMDPDENSLLPKEQIIPNSPSPSKSLDYCRSPIAVEELLPAQKPKKSVSPPPDRLPLQTLGASEVNSKITNTPQELCHDQAKPLDYAPSPAPDSLVNVPKGTPSISPPKSFRNPKTPMGPPPIPSRSRSRGHVSAVNSRIPSFLPNRTHASSFRSATNPNTKLSQRHHILQGTQEEQPPTSTQLFMLGHLDDLFPSPSQEVREIFGEPKFGIGGNGAEPKSKAACTNKSPTRRKLPNKPISAVSRPDRFGSVVRDEKTRNIPTQGRFLSIQAKESPSLPTANIHSSGNSESFDMPFFSTQDFFLSSQDLEDLENGKTSPMGPERRNGCNSYNSSAEKTAWNGNTGLTTSLHPPDQKQSRGSIPDFRLSPARDRSRSIHAHLLGEPAECLKSPKPSREETTTPNTFSDSNYSQSRNLKNTADCEKPTDKIHEATSQGHQKKSLSTLQAKKNMAPPRASPKPFFTSSDREIHRIYTNERIKTIAWESASTRRNVQQELKRLQKLEDEKSNRSMPLCAIEDGNKGSIKPGVSGSESRTESSSTRLCDQDKDQSRPRSINQLSSSAGSLQSQKIDEPKEVRPRQNQSRSSYEKMLELLERTESRKQEQVAVTASQETDYGEAGLDDVLSEIL